MKRVFSTFFSVMLALACLSLPGAETGSAAARIAFRKQLEKKDYPPALLEKGMKDPDPVIRAYCIHHYTKKKGAAAKPVLLQMSGERDPRVVDTILCSLLELPWDPAMAEFAQKMARYSAIPRMGMRLSSPKAFSFYRKNVRLKDNPAWDHDISVIRTVPIPVSGWKMTTDPVAIGHEKGFFKPDFDDSKWVQLKKITFWEEQGFPGYDGYGWYRIRFRMPAEMKEANAVELAFGAVDEEAWVWLNGKYIGQHTMGPDGWKIPFHLDVTKEILWGRENLLVVRVFDSEAAGGIWKPVNAEVLK